MAKSLRQIRKLKSKAAALPESAAEDLDFLLDAHLAILSGSRLIRVASSGCITEDRFNAEYAVQTEVSSIAQHFAAMDDAYLAGRIQDIRDVGARLIRNLSDRKFQAFATLPEGTIIIAEEITPSDTALMDPEAGRRLRHQRWAVPRATPRSWRGRWGCRRCWAPSA